MSDDLIRSLLQDPNAVLVKPWHPDQGPFVVMHKDHFDESKHERFVPPPPSALRPPTATPIRRKLTRTFSRVAWRDGQARTKPRKTRYGAPRPTWTTNIASAG